MLKSQLQQSLTVSGFHAHGRSSSEPDMTTTPIFSNGTHGQESPYDGLSSVVGSLCDDNHSDCNHAPQIPRQDTGVPRDLVYGRGGVGVGRNGSINGGHGVVAFSSQFDFQSAPATPAAAAGEAPATSSSSSSTAFTRLRRARSGEVTSSVSSTSSSSRNGVAVPMPAGGRGRGRGRQQQSGFFHPPTPAVRPGMRMVNGRSRSFNKDLVNLFNQSVQQSHQTRAHLQNGNLPPPVDVNFNIDESSEENPGHGHSKTHRCSSPRSREALKKYYAWLKFQAANREVLLNIKPPKVEAWKKKSQLRSPPIHLVIYVLGSERSGKRSLVKSFVRPEQYQRASKIPGNGTKSLKNVHVTIDNQRYILEIRSPPQVPIDLEHHPSVVKQRLKSYEGVHAFIMCYSVFWSPALDAIKNRWIPEIQSAFADGDSLRSPPPFLIVGTKTDARPGYPGYKPGILDSLIDVGDVPNFVDFLDAKCIAQECGAEKYLECTARVGNAGANGVNAVFAAAIKAGRAHMKSDISCVTCLTCTIL